MKSFLVCLIFASVSSLYAARLTTSEELVAAVRDGSPGAVIELGPGKVLKGLMGRIDKEAEVIPVEDRESLEAAVGILKA